MKRSIYIAAIALVTIIAVVRVASTHRKLNATVDEPVHLAAGWMWLSGSYTDLGHPPLARVLSALPLRMAGLPDPPVTDDTSRGHFLLYHGDRYLKNLSRARIGNLFLLIVAILAVAEQTRRAFGHAAAIWSAALFTNLPPILGHAGVITTDMAATATLPLALLALDLFLESPTIKRGALLGAAIGAGVLAKFSFLVFFPAAALVVLGSARLARIRRASRPAAITPAQDAPPVRAGRPLSSLAMTTLVAFLVTWAGYQFDFRPVSKVFPGASFFLQIMVPEPARAAVRTFSDNVPIPAPALPIGIGILRQHDKDGHFTNFLGQTGTKGWWHYFPVVFFFKTPIPFLLLALCGAFLAFRTRLGIEHALIPIVILLVAMTGSINIGVRHVLPMYASLSVIAGFAAVELWRRARGPFAQLGMTALMAWLFLGVATQHPDYLAWFNEAADEKPWRIATDSNLDWGQDVLRLEKVMRELRIERVWIRYSTGAPLARHGIAHDVLPDHPVSGWIAIGETPASFFPDRVEWLTRYEPVRRVGKSMRLYYVP
jgi:hypothetical protein